MPKLRTAALPPLDVVSARFRLDPLTGVVWWRPAGPEHFKTQRAWKIFMNRDAGSVAGHQRKDGYRELKIHVNGKPIQVMVHWVVWALTYGEWPAHELDHINLQKNDNRPENLRAATRTQNNVNKRWLGNESGFKGVTRDKRWAGSRWRARFRFGDREVSLGLFDTPEEAHAAYTAAVIRTHGEFFRPASAA